MRLGAVLGILLLLLLTQAAASTSSLFLAERASLDALEKGVGLAALLCQSDPSGNHEKFDTCPLYQQLVRVLEKDIVERAALIPSEVPHHVFSSRWLASRDTRFRLIGIVPRPDRRAFIPNSCGELRLIYRLAGSYQEDGESFETFLPLTSMIVLELPARSSACVFLREGLPSDVAEFIPSALRQSRLRLEINLQNLHVPAPSIPESAGYSEYLLRIFSIDRKKAFLTEMALENTPDVEKIQQSPELQKELQAWVDRNELLLPEKFTAKRAISISPFGLFRKENSPYSGLVKGSFEQLRSLNTRSCQGCHQTQSDAGFHFLGESLPKSFALNRTQNFASTHFFSELSWRAQKDYSARPVPGRTFQKEGTQGDLCSSPDFEGGYRCREGFKCRQFWDKPEVREQEFGYCQSAKVPLPGEPCLIGQWSEKKIFPGFESLSTTNCYGDGLCMPQEIGFPGGLCVTDCDNLLAGTACQKVPALQSFADCRAKGGGLKKCTESASRDTALRSCGIDTPCRPDYICLKASNPGENKSGVCVPPYFLSQLNISHHHFDDSVGALRRK